MNTMRVSGVQIQVWNQEKNGSWPKWWPNAHFMVYLCLTVLQHVCMWLQVHKTLRWTKCSFKRKNNVFKRRCELLLPHTPHYLTLSGPSSSFTGNPVCIVHKYGKGVSEQYLLWFMSSLCYVFWHSSTITHAQQEGNSPPDAPHLSLIVAIHIQEYATRLFHF